MAYSIHNLKGAALTIIVSAVFFSLIASNFPNYSKGIYAQEDAVQYNEYKYEVQKWSIQLNYGKTDLKSGNLLV